ncbi:unnamed protein product, partial [Iphiclides podalirius]
MSAVMSTLSMISGGRRAHRKLTSSRKSGQLSDAGEDRARSQHDLSKQQRSASLQTLEAGAVVDLENLEAKMASIEVSLAGARRRSGARDADRELDTLRAALSDKDTLIQTLKKQLSASLSAARLAAQATSPTGSRGSQRGDSPTTLSADERHALEERAAAINADLEARKSSIHELRRRLEKTHVTENIDTRIQQAELQYQLGREELELLTLSEQARALAQLMEHADAAGRFHATLYSLVRECGGTATVLSTEVSSGSWNAVQRAAGVSVHWAAEHSPLRQGDRILEVNGTPALSFKCQEDLQRAFGNAATTRLVVLRDQKVAHSAPSATHFTQNEAASLRAELGALRTAAEDAERAKEGLRADNTRLTHRISYLEEQVAELLAKHTQLHPVSSSDSCITVNKTKKNVTNISITTEPKQGRRTSPKSEVQVFQKGPDITAIVAKLPGLEGPEANLPVMRPRSNASGASSRIATSPRTSPTPNRRSHSSHSLEHRAGRLRHSLSQHCVHGAADYGAETDAAIRMIERNQRHMEKQRIKCEKINKPQSKIDDHFRSDSDLDVDVHSKRKTLSIIEQLKRTQRMRKMKKNDSAEDVKLETEKHMYHRIDGKVLENAHKSSRRSSSKVHSRSAKSSELESEYSDYPNGEAYGSEGGSTRAGHGMSEEGREGGKSRPTPPRKPLRLSLHKARSAHSILNGSESETPSEAPSGDPSKRPVKRTHAADKWARERMREGGRATPRPARKLQSGLSGLSGRDAPAADDLYPETMHVPVRVGGAVHGKWC